MIKKNLDTLLNDINQSSETCLTAQSLSKKMDALETTFLIDFWSNILICINSVSKVLQKQNMNSLVAFKLIKSSVAYVREEIVLKKMNPKWMKNVVLMTIKILTKVQDSAAAL